MKYNTIIFSVFTWFLGACSPQKEHDPTITATVTYTSYSSLDGSKTTRSGTLTYLYDTALYYHVMSSDSMLYYNYKTGHGLLDVKAKTLFRHTELDESGRPVGVIESELIPQFLADTSYISDLEKDTAIAFYQKKNIGNMILLERYNDEISYSADSSGKCENERVFLCYNRSTRKIYFQITVLSLNISGIPFTQIDKWTFSYPDDPSKTLDAYRDLISTAKTYQDPVGSKSSADSTRTIPDFNYSDLNDLDCSSKDIQQKYTLLEFWYMSCAPCLRNMQHLNSLYANYKSLDVKFLVLNDADPDVGKLKKIHNNYALKYEIYYRGDGLKKALGIEVHPHTIIYDTHASKIIYEIKGTGDTYVHEIEHVLDSLLQIK